MSWAVIYLDKPQWRALLWPISLLLIPPSWGPMLKSFQSKSTILFGSFFLYFRVHYIEKSKPNWSTSSLNVDTPVRLDRKSNMLIRILGNRAISKQVTLNVDPIDNYFMSASLFLLKSFNPVPCCRHDSLLF